MRNVRRLAIIAASVGIAALPVVLEIGPAKAHFPTITGQTTCIDNGQWSVTWTMRSWEARGRTWTIVGAGRAAHVNNVSLATLTPTGFIPDDQPFFLTETFPASVTSVLLWANGQWDDDVQGNAISPPVSPPTCGETTTTTQPPTSPPTTPPTTQPPTTPPTTPPPSTDPATTPPASTDPATTPPASTDPATTPPASTDPATTPPSQPTTTQVGQEGPTTSTGQPAPTTSTAGQAPPTTSASGQAPPTTRPPGSGVTLPSTGSNGTLTSLLTALLLLLGGLVITRLARAE
jgi:hypothetical protein